MPSTEVAARIEESCVDVGDEWVDRVAAGLRAFLAFVAENPPTARMCLVEAVSATPAASARYDDAMGRFVDLLRGQRAR